MIIPLQVVLICFIRPLSKVETTQSRWGRGPVGPVAGAAGAWAGLALRRRPVDCGEAGLNLAQGPPCGTVCGRHLGEFSALLSGTFPVVWAQPPPPGWEPQRLSALAFSSVQLCRPGTAPLGWPPVLTWGRPGCGSCGPVPFPFSPQLPRTF